jgi:hypothetical protein
MHARHDETGNYLVDENGNDVACIYEMAIVEQILNAVNVPPPKDFKPFNTYPEGCKMNRDEAVLLLAERLYKKMDHLDPQIDAPEWAGLTDRQREFYRLCIEAIFDERRLTRLCIK